MISLEFYHAHSTSVGGKDLSNDTQSRVIGSMEPEICTEMLRNLSKKLRAKFPVTTHGYSIVKIACLNENKPGRRSITAAKR